MDLFLELLWRHDYFVDRGEEEVRRVEWSGAERSGADQINVDFQDLLTHTHYIMLFVGI
jgi:hypothetical protein